MDSFQGPFDHYSNQDLVDDSLLLNELIVNNEEEGVLLRSKTGPDLGYIHDEKINEMMGKITSITDEDANKFMEIIGEITTNNNDLKLELKKTQQGVDVIKKAIDESKKISIDESNKRSIDESNKIDKDTFETLKKNYEIAKEQHRKNRENIIKRIRIYNGMMKQNAINLQSEKSNLDIPVTSEQFKGAEQEQEEERKQFEKQLKILQESYINPLILDGLDRSLEELQKTALEPMSHDGKEELERIYKSQRTDSNTQDTKGGRRTKKGRNMRRNSKRKKPMRKKSMRKKSMRKKSMRKKSMRRRRSSKKKY